MWRKINTLFPYKSDRFRNTFSPNPHLLATGKRKRFIGDDGDPTNASQIRMLQIAHGTQITSDGSDVHNIYVHVGLLQAGVFRGTRRPPGGEFQIGINNFSTVPQDPGQNRRF